MVRVDPNTGAQSVYATIPHLAACPNALPPGPCKVGDWSCLPPGPCDSGRCLPPGPCTPTPGGACLPPGPCAPVAVDRGSLPNDLAFDDAGNLYVTDSFQATIFRVPPGGGQAEAFYQDPRLDTSTIPGFSVGLNGIRVSPDRSKLVVTQTFGINSGVLTLPLIDHPPLYTLQMVKSYGNNELPDGLAYGASGRLYVTLAGTNQIGLIDPLGREFFRASSSLLDNPANVAFDGRGALLITNHALFGNPADGGVLNMQVFDVASPLARPIIP
ncbi:MAG: SMP-30/gluconolactonase/LRE family protein [Minicystis sp.]